MKNWLLFTIKENLLVLDLMPVEMRLLGPISLKRGKLLILHRIEHFIVSDAV